MENKKLIVFDLDGTLAISKSVIDPAMAGLLVKLLNVKRVAVISGAGFPQFQKELVAELEQCEAAFENLFLFPTCGAAHYRYNSMRKWELIYQELLTDRAKEKITEAFQRVFHELHYQHPKVTYGAPPLEDRGSQMSFSPLGQAAPVEKKEEWRRINDVLRTTMCKMLANQLPEFEFRCGGLTTIDVTRRGVDKAYGIKKMEEYLGIPREAMLFIGDKLEPDGNDHPVKILGVECIAVQSPEETKKIIEDIIKSGTSAR